MGLLGRERSLTISSAVWLQYTNVTDRRTDTGRQQRPRLRIASRGKNQISQVQVLLIQVQVQQMDSKMDLSVIGLQVRAHVLQKA